MKMRDDFVELGMSLCLESGIAGLECKYGHFCRNHI